MQFKKISGLLKSIKLRIYLMVIASILIVYSLFSAFVYMNARNVAFEQANNANESVLTQMKYNIDFVDNLVKENILSVYFNDQSTYLMYSSSAGDDMMRTSITINELTTNYIIPNTFIQSLQFYNSKADMLFSTSGDLIHDAGEAQQILASTEGEAMLAPVIRRVADKSKGKTESVILTYALGEYLPNKKDFDGALFFNVNINWLLDNIRNISTINGPQSAVYVIDTKTQNFLNAGQNAQQEAWLTALYKKSIAPLKDTKNQGYAVSSTHNQKEFVSYLFLEQPGWVILRVVSYDALFSHLTGLSRTLVFLAILFFFFTLGVTVLSSKSMYSPLRRLISDVSETSGHDCKSLNEIEYLRTTFRNIHESLREYEYTHRLDENVYKEYVYRNLFYIENADQNREFSQALKQGKLEVNFERPFTVCVMQINQSTFFEKRTDEFSRLGLMEALVSKTDARIHPADVISIQNNLTVFVKNVPDGMEALLKQLDSFKTEFECANNILMTVSVSEEKTGIQAVYTAFWEALYSANYRFFVKGKVIRPADVKAKTEYRCFPVDKEQRLLEALRAADVETANKTVSAIFSNTDDLSYYNLALYISRVASTVNFAVFESCHGSYRDLVSNNLLSFSPDDYESMSDFTSRCAAFIKEHFQNDSRTLQNDSRKIMVESIHSIIRQNYSNPLLCLNHIADQLKLSPQYIGRVFREVTGKSISESINDIRLEFAMDWLIHTNLSTVQIMNKVGIQSESLFYRHFKRKYGLTPKEYAHQSLLNQQRLME